MIEVTAELFREVNKGMGFLEITHKRKISSTRGYPLDDKTANLKPRVLLEYGVPQARRKRTA